MDGMGLDWILLRRLVQLEHLAVLIIGDVYIVTLLMNMTILRE